LREALEQEHQGNIYLFHASLNAQGLYYQDEIQQLMEDAPNLHYIPCVLNGEAPQGGKQGAVDQIIVNTLGDCTGKRAYLCGDDAVVETMKKTLFMHGVAEKDILADAFVISA
jgi:ferredoxin-NADP reductase